MRLPPAWAALLASLILGFAAVDGEETAPAAALPAGVVALSPEQSAHLQELLAAAERYRGLKARRPVPAGVLAEPELRLKMAESVREDLPAGQLAAVEIGAKAFGLIPQSMDLGRYLPELLTSQVAGFYDPKKDYLALVRRAEGGEQNGWAEPEDAILVHELTHALQDQHFDLERLTTAEPLSDAATARSALAEGDATLTMTSYLAGRDVETVPGVGEAVKGLLEDPSQRARVAAEIPGGSELASAPGWIRDTLLFGYIQGFAFCLEVRRRGGQKLLDYAFATDPPRSSEQILHPEKWLAQRDDPLVLTWPDLSAVFPRWTKAAQGEVGEATIQTLLRMKVRDREKVAAGAAGWGGDTFVVYERHGRRVLLWWTEWDSETDAREFQAAAAALGSGWTVAELSPRRVLATRGSLTREQRLAVRTRLAAAAAILPDNRPIDLRTIGAAAPAATD